MSSTGPLFSQFDTSFQEKIIQALLIDRQWSMQMIEVIKPEFFELAYLQKIVDVYINYQRKYKDFPSIQLMNDIFKEELKNGIDKTLREQVMFCLKKLSSNKDLGDLGYVKERSLEFCKKMALKSALETSVDMIAGNNYESVVGIIKKAINLGTNNDPGLDLSEDVEARYKENARKTIPTGIKELDQKEVLAGGLGVGELGIVMAFSKVGKSHSLVQLGANALRERKNVLYFTYELRQIPTAIRFDSNLLDIPSSFCCEHKEEINKFYKDNIETLGKLKIKFYPAGTATVVKLSAYVDKLATEGFIPDLIIVDYLELMRSTKRNELLRTEIKDVCEELRAFADEENVPIWSAIQGNRGSHGDKEITLENAAESLGSIRTADIILGLSRKPENKLSGIGALAVLGNRVGQDGQKYTVHIDTSRSKITVLGDSEYQSEDMDKASKESFQTAMRNAYKRTQKSNQLEGIPYESVRQNG